jgi:outer membrane protein OmpA-like peptidoglycan-associated protein
VSERRLFVSFAESDGGHSYLAMRSMLDPNSIGHMLFRTTVADVLDTVIAGQANFAVVPFYNSITQWEGATLKALASGQFRIHAQMCMPTSYVLAAHKEYMSEFVERYRLLSDPNATKSEPSSERAKKIYTRFLTRIFVNAQAEEQYRGRLLRPDMAQATIEHTRNPLRVLEEISRNELMKDLQYGVSRNARQQNPVGPGHQGQAGFGGTIFVSPPPNVPTISELNVPAVLIASGLLDIKTDQDGWDRHGSVGEILSLLKNLLELLDVYSFGAPDLPENKTKYLLISKRDTKLPANALLPIQGNYQQRTMVLARTNYKNSSADQWQRPREKLVSKTSGSDYVFDRSPIPVESSQLPVFLFEGGKTKTAKPKPEKANTAKSKEKPASQFQDLVEKKDDKKTAKQTKKGTADDNSLISLGEYKSWCAPCKAHSESCSCADEPTASPVQPPKCDWWCVAYGVGGTLIALTLLYFAYALGYCTLTGACPANKAVPVYEHPSVPNQTPPPGSPDQVQPQPTYPDRHPPNAPQSPAPGNGEESRPPSTYPGYPDKGPSPSEDQIGSSDRKPSDLEKTTPVATTKPLLLHVAFMESKSNLTRESYNVLTTAAAQSLQSNRDISVRVFALGSRESDGALWRRRLYAVKDELVRLGIPVQRIRTEGAGPYMLRITRLPQSESRKPVSTGGGTSSDLDTLDDPFSNE